MFSRINTRKIFGRIIMFTALLVTATLTGSANKTQAQGAVFAMTNSPIANSVIMSARAINGVLIPIGEFFTGGAGTGAGLTNATAIVLTPNHHELFAVNAATNNISVFSVRSNELVLLQCISSGGTTPVSLTATNNWVYVVNAGSPNNIAGFSIGANGLLTPIPGSIESLSAAVTKPAQIKFSPFGNVLVVTEQNTNNIDVFAVESNGAASPAITVPSSGPHPFGFDFDPAGHLLVSEAVNNGASSYYVSPYGILDISPSLLDAQNATCWLAANGSYAWVANAASDNLSAYAIAPSGALRLINQSGGVAVQLPTGSHPTDEVIDNKGHLYVLDANLGAVTGLLINANGTLTIINSTPAFGVGMSGVAAY
jgi:6-phosphogluconolactonase (cycloisomerase 2 family)